MNPHPTDQSVPAQGTRRTIMDMRMQSSESVANAIAVLEEMDLPDRAPIKQLDAPDLSVCIIVPTYNDSDFLHEALQSVQNQSFQNWTCVIVDDNSPQPIERVLAEFVNDDRFVLCRHRANRGLSAARNTGIRFAQSDLLQFLDADDMLTPWALQSRVEKMTHEWFNPLVAGAHGDVKQCTEETTLDDLQLWQTNPQVALRDWLSVRGESPFIVHQPLVRTSLAKSIGGFDEAFKNGAEDWDSHHPTRFPI